MNTSATADGGKYQALGVERPRGGGDHEAGQEARRGRQQPDANRHDAPGRPRPRRHSEVDPRLARRADEQVARARNVNASVATSRRATSGPNSRFSPTIAKMHHIALKTAWNPSSDAKNPTT